jgi:hypothetical protein
MSADELGRQATAKSLGKGFLVFRNTSEQILAEHTVGRRAAPKRAADADESVAH